MKTVCNDGCLGSSNILMLDITVTIYYILKTLNGCNNKVIIIKLIIIKYDNK